MIVQYSPFFIPLLISAVITGALTYIGWRDRDNPMSPPFILLMGACTIWSVSYAILLVSADLATNLLMTGIEYTGIVTVPVAWLLLVLCYTGREQYVTRRNILLLFIVPILIVALVVTNPLHLLYYPAITPQIIDGSVLWNFSHGPLFWISVIYSYFLVILAFYLIISRFSGSPDIYRRQILLLFFASAIPLFANSLYVVHLSPFEGLDLTPFAFTITGIIVALGIIRYQLLSMVPVAYPLIFSTINDGIIVVDRKNRISDLNPAALQIVQGSTRSVIGKPLGDILPRMVPFIDDRKSCMQHIPHEITIPQENDSRDYEVICRLIPSEIGSARGYLIILRDITERQRSRKAIEMANKKMNLLSTITRHDLMNKLTGLSGYIDLAKNADDEPGIRKFLPKIEEMARVILEELEFTRDYQDLGMKEPMWQDVTQQVMLAQGQVNLKGSTLITDITGLEVYADPLLPKVIYNLIENAIRHGEHVTAMQFRYECHGDDLHIIFEDDGAGISADDKEKLFRRGFGKHTGLGLFLIREILSITGITITENGIPGKGARFEITVPKGIWRSAKMDA